MRKLFIIILTIVSIALNATTYYVSTTGNNSWNGLDSVYVSGTTGPWASWQKAFQTAVAGDTVYFRGGTYYPTVTSGMGMAPSNSGTAANPICFFNYPGETPVLDNSTLDSDAIYSGYGYNYCINYQSPGTLGFHKYKGLEIKNVWQQGNPMLCAGINIGGCSNLWFENMSVHDISGGCFVMVNFDSIWVKNCDAYNACDTTHPTMPGNWGMGFSMSNRVSQWGAGAALSYVYYEGCRAWHCSDYGFAGGPVEGYVEWNNCWSWKHGDFHFEGMTGEGVGWKQGGLSDEIEWSNDPCRVMRNCIAAENGNYGFGENNGGYKGYNFRGYNNTSYHNGYLNRTIDESNPQWGVGFKFEAWVADASIVNVFRNNVSFNNRHYYDYGDENIGVSLRGTKDHNSWDVSGLPHPDSTDFISLDYTEMLAPRKADGSLPDINFLKLSPTSDLRDLGYIDDYSRDPYYSTAPDIGAWEYTPGPQIIADHSIVDDYQYIPQHYIDSVKKMCVSYAGESHSAAVRTGLALLEAEDATFAVNATESGTPEAYTDDYLRISRATWGDLTHSTGWIYEYGEEDWFTSSTAIERTKAGLTYINTNGPTLSAFGFGWCWDLGESATDYVEATKEYIDYVADSIGTKIFYTTGPVDTYTWANGYSQHLKYETIRDSVDADTTRILFDFADILCYDDDGSGPNLFTDGGYNYPIITTANLTPTTTGHISNIGAIRLAKAMWWMLARMAGWDGNVTVYSEQGDSSIVKYRGLIFKL